MSSSKRTSTSKSRFVSWEGGDPKDSLEYLEMAAEGAVAKIIQELHGIMRRQPVDLKDGAMSGGFRNS